MWNSGNSDNLSVVISLATSPLFWSLVIWRRDKTERSNSSKMWHSNKILTMLPFSVEITNKMQPCNRIYYSEVYWRLKMFRAAHRSSSGALNCICRLQIQFRAPDDERCAARKHVEPSRNFGIINSVTSLHLVGYFYWIILRCTDPWILNF